MTNHMQAAIEAGAKAMAPVNGNTRNFHLLPDGWLAESKAALDAMLPHLREMIAEEIRGDVKDFEPSCQEDIFWHDAHMNAARIAKGPEQ